ncbi:hypothetical protein GP486_002530 [Trichoglossum hirsutum]|uniref:HNH nuclease domain-containing protein n=1 Tax=Trichoglossum hirsutum TaxID=265104 RepID=A0A9P8RRM7_9PEZI|nr:hypothetical protein GP486_002530 [Trichoglossum hirsutum]
MSRFTLAKSVERRYVLYIPREVNGISLHNFSKKTLMETIQLRPPAPLPAQEYLYPIADNHVIKFKHPGYPEKFGQNILLQLYAWDSPNGGLHAGTALLACAIIACNAWDGYLTVERDGPKLELQYDDVLPIQGYYFHVPRPEVESIGPTGDDSHYKYPIYASFQHWAFPHEQIPSQWRGAISTEVIYTPSISSVSAAVISRDGSCVISKNRDYIERAHLCPRNELDWFHKNSMWQYNRRHDIAGDAVTDDIANALAIRSDIHRAFDEGKFVLARKSNCWAVHFLGNTCDLGRMYHNRPIEVKAGVSLEFILTRFAWAIFPLVRGFMERGPERVVKVPVQCEEGLEEEIVKTLDPAGFEQITAASRGRSASPKKRKAASIPVVAEVKRFCTISHLKPDDEMPTSTDYQSDNEEEKKEEEEEEEKEEKEKEEEKDCTLDVYSDDRKNSVQPLPTQVSHGFSARRKNFNAEDEAEIKRLSNLRMDELRKRRPKDPSLFCCDYSRAERANALGIPGKPEYGGGHLCMECLGLEYTSYLE